MTEANPLLLFQPTRDLFGTPILSQQALHHRPDLGGDPGYGFLFAPRRQFMSLLRTIAAFTSIPFQFAAHAGLMNPNYICNLRKRLFGFHQRINLVSLFLGKLAVGSHSAPLTWSSEKHYPTPAYLSATFKVALGT